MKWSVLIPFVICFGCAKPPPSLAPPQVVASKPKPSVKTKAPTPIEYVLPALGKIPVKCKIDGFKPVERVCMMYRFRCEHDTTFVAEICPMIENNEENEEQEEVTP